MEIICTEFRPMSRNTLKGFVTLIYAGLVLKDCLWHESSEGGRKEWISFPARPIKDSDTKEVRYSAVIEFAEGFDRTAFQDAAVKAIYKHSAHNNYSGFKSKNDRGKYKGKKQHRGPGADTSNLTDDLPW